MYQPERKQCSKVVRSHTEHLEPPGGRVVLLQTSLQDMGEEGLPLRDTPTGAGRRAGGVAFPFGVLWTVPCEHGAHRASPARGETLGVALPGHGVTPHLTRGGHQTVSTAAVSPTITTVSEFTAPPS